ncbi:MAG: molybdate ABC transporter substrate-binding protein [Planctomycetales bacterium]
MLALDRPRRVRGRFALWMIVSLSLAACGPASPTAVPQQTASPPRAADAKPTVREVRVAAAADLKFALPDLIVEFSHAHPEIQVTATYGSSGNLYAQLSHGAPFDLFLSADIEYARRLVEQGDALGESEFSYGLGRLVVWTPRDSQLDVAARGLELLTDPAVRTIAIANPQHAPYGRAAVAAMTQAGVYDQVVSRLVLGDNIAQAAQFVESGNAEVGIIALSIAVAPTLREKGRYFTIPLEEHPPILQGGVIASEARDLAAAQEFRQFLRGPTARGIFSQFGFVLPEE